MWMGTGGENRGIEAAGHVGFGWFTKYVDVSSYVPDSLKLLKHLT